MKYVCKLCNYQTDTSSNWCIHKKTKKHQLLEMNSEKNNNEKVILDNNDKIIEKKLVQKLEEIILDKDKAISKLEQEKIILNQKISKLEEEKNKLASQLDKEKTETIKELKGELKNNNNYYKQMINNAGTLVHKSMTTMEYLVKNYNSAPQLQQLTDYSDISDNEQKLIDTMIYHQKRDTLHEYFGNYIIKNYKKNNPKDQSMWNTDSDRLNYIVRELVKDNKNMNILIEELNDLDDLDEDQDPKNKIEWIIDKKGIKVAEYVIVPLLNHIKKICSNYISKNTNNKLSSKELEKQYKKLEILAEINSDISNGNLLKNINKYIAYHFYINKKKLLSIK